VCVRVCVLNVQIYFCFHTCGGMCVCTAVDYVNLHSDSVTIHRAFSLAPTHSFHSVELRTYEGISVDNITVRAVKECGLTYAVRALGERVCVDYTSGRVCAESRSWFDFA